MAEHEIFETQDGSHSILSRQYGVSYHSKYGAIQETQHVFIKAGLFFQALHKNEIHILDIGFGTGLNALITLFESREKGLTVYYEAIEKYPLSEEEWKSLNYPDLLNQPDASALFQTLHEGKWEEEITLTPAFSFRKKQQDIRTVQYDEDFDLIYFDAFAPTAQPELWEADVMERMYQALRPGGILVTYCAKGAFKRILKAIGFTVEAIQGPPGKREMTRAIKPEV